jgi:hypothetical protein
MDIEEHEVTIVVGNVGEENDGDTPSEVEIIDTTTNVPKSSTRIFMDRKDLLHWVSRYIWLIDRQEWLE